VITPFAAAALKSGIGRKLCADTLARGGPSDGKSFVFVRFRVGSFGISLIGASLLLGLLGVQTPRLLLNTLRSDILFL
jgi:hypothetical protein